MTSVPDRVKVPLPVVIGEPLTASPVVPGLKVIENADCQLVFVVVIALTWLSPVAMPSNSPSKRPGCAGMAPAASVTKLYIRLKVSPENGIVASYRCFCAAFAVLTVVLPALAALALAAARMALVKALSFIAVRASDGDMTLLICAPA